MIDSMDDEDPYNIMMIMTISTTTRLELVGNPGGNKQRGFLQQIILVIQILILFY